MKRTRERLRTHRVEILLGLALLLPLLVPSGAGLAGLATGTLVPLLPAVGDLPAEPGDDAAWRELSFRLIEENAELRARLVALGEPARLVALDESYWARQPRRVEAAVLGRDASPWRGSVVISAGEREGLREGLPALVGNSLVGIVAGVGPLASRVRLLTDPGQRVWGEIVSGEEVVEGYLEGPGEEVLFLHLARAGPGRPGDPVFTAGGTELVPRGLLVGNVSRIGDVDRDGIAEVEVAPAVRRAGLRFVNVLVPEGR